MCPLYNERITDPWLDDECTNYYGVAGTKRLEREGKGKIRYNSSECKSFFSVCHYEFVQLLLASLDILIWRNNESSRRQERRSS